MLAYAFRKVSLVYIRRFVVLYVSMCSFVEVFVGWEREYGEEGRREGGIWGDVVGLGFKMVEEINARKLPD